jgi:hypothetical protein
MSSTDTRSVARDYFKNCGLSYKDIDIRALRYLEIELNDQFNRISKAVINNTHYKYENGEQKPKYWVRINPAKYYKGTYDEQGRLIYARMTARGTYFTARDVIEFCKSGCICFAPDADAINLIPVVTAFFLWCDWLAGQKREAAANAEADS